MRHYEVATVLHPDLEIDLDSTLSKIESIIEGSAGKVTKKDNWGKRKLAYRINGQDWGIFVFFTCEIDPSSVAAIESNLNITEEVMRHLVVSLEHLRPVSDHTTKNRPKSEEKKPAATSDDVTPETE